MKSTELEAPKVGLEAIVGPLIAALIRANHDCIKTFQIGRATGIPSSRARRLLDKAVSAGLLVRNAHYSAANCLAWSVPPNTSVEAPRAARSQLERDVGQDGG